MNKLENNMAVKREGMTQDLLDLFVVLAERDGFDMSRQEEYTINTYKGDYIKVSSGCECFQHYPEELNIITDKEMAFCGAPDWAVDVRKFEGKFVWTNGNKTFKYVGSTKQVYSSWEIPVTNWPVVITRAPEEKPYIPEVGEKLLGVKGFNRNVVKEWFSFPRYEVCPIHSDNKQFFVEKLDKKGNRLDHVEKFNIGSDQYKPLPKHSGEELMLIDEMMNAYKGYYGKECFAHIAQELIKAGWRKNDNNLEKASK